MPFGGLLSLGLLAGGAVAKGAVGAAKNAEAEGVEMPYLQRNQMDALTQQVLKNRLARAAQSDADRQNELLSGVGQSTVAESTGPNLGGDSAALSSALKNRAMRMAASNMSGARRQALFALPGARMGELAGTARLQGGARDLAASNANKGATSRFIQDQERFDAGQRQRDVLGAAAEDAAPALYDFGKSIFGDDPKKAEADKNKKRIG